MKTKLLLIEDDDDFGIILKQYLNLSEFDVTWVLNPLDALPLMSQNAKYDIVVLDVMMPQLDGFTLAQTIKKNYPNLPFLFLTAKNQKIDRLTGLKIGADDYQTKPCDPEELILRIHNILKRHKPLATSKPLPLGEYLFDHENLLLKHPKEKIRLTQREADLLQLLLQYNNSIVKREVILNGIWNSDDYFTGRSMDVFVSRLRKYLQHDKHLQILSIRGIGFEINFPD